MLERWAKRIQWGKIADGLKPVVRVWSISPGGWITLGVLIVFGAFTFRSHSNRDGQRREIANAYGGARTFYGQAQLSHDGAKLVYVSTTQTRSCALYLYDLNSKQTREVFVERDGLGYWGDDYELRCWPWSPDDRSFIYTIKDRLVICPVDAPTNATELIVGQNVISQLAWLAPDRFAFVNQNKNLCVAEKQAGGTWRQFGIPFPDNLTGLTAVNDTTVAWLQNGLICHLDLDEYNRSLQPSMGVTPSPTISWSHNVWGFDRALPLKNTDRPISNIYAGIILSSNWNDSWSENAAIVRAEGVTVNNLYDNAGNRTGANLTYSAWNGACMVHHHIGPDADGTFNRELLNGYLNAGPAAWNPPITKSVVAFTNIPYPEYDVIVYFGGDAAKRRGCISDGTTGYYFSTIGPDVVNGVNAVFSPTMETNASIFPKANFALFPGRTNQSLTLTCDPLSGDDQWLGISAIQIIQSSNVFVAGEVVPKTQTVTDGQPAHFEVLAGGLTPRFQWRHEGTNLIDGTNAQLCLKAVTAKDAGRYDVVIANDFNSVTSSVAQLACHPGEIISSRQRTGRSNGLASGLKAAVEITVPVPTNGLVLWLDASTLQQSNQTPVVRLPDLSGQNNHAVEYGHAPSFNAPDSVAGLNDKGTIHFSSSGALTNATGLKTSRPLGISGASPRTVIAVMRRLPGKGMFVSLGNCGAKGEYCGLCDQEWAVYLPAGMVTDNFFPALPPQWNILSMVYDGNTQKGFVNGIFKGNSSFPMNTPDTEVELGLRKARSGDMRQSGASDGDFAELLIYDRAIDVGEQLQIENYLSQKWFGGSIVNTLNPFLWANPPVGRITSISCSPLNQELLISSLAGQMTTLWRYNTNGVLTELAKGTAIQAPQWIAANRVAYINRKAGHRQIIVVDLAGTETDEPLAQGDAAWFAPDFSGNKLLLFGTVSNEPANGIWSYDFASKQLHPLIAYSDHPVSNAKKVEPFRAFIDWPKLSCLVYPPSKIDPHKKYPLVISDTLTYDPIHGPMFQSGLADCGAYVAIVERNSWYGGIEQWETNVLNLCQKLKQDPAVDANNIYLYAASAETQYLSDLVEKTPGLWRGIILLNPSRLPDFSKSPLWQKRPKILISAGSEEHADERLKRYQANALQWGVLVEFLVSPGEAHRFIGKMAKQQRLQKVSQFVFEE